MSRKEEMIKYLEEYVAYAQQSLDSSNQMLEESKQRYQRLFTNPKSNPYVITAIKDQEDVVARWEKIYTNSQDLLEKVQKGTVKVD